MQCTQLARKYLEQLFHECGRIIRYRRAKIYEGRPAMINLCTLFDSHYLDRGIVLYQSLERNCKEFQLYILCLDDIAYTTLNKMKLKKVILISEDEIMDKKLKQIRKERRRAEYCWTCTPVVLQYTLDRYLLDQCTYIDADMMFYSDPSVMLEELINAGGSVGIIGHRFPNNIARKKRERYYGKYCVEFNTFLNDVRGRTVLEYWKECCYKNCTMELGQKGYGDQKYLEEWEEKFEGVYEYQNLGAGVAPWNICEYRLQKLQDQIQLKYRRKECDLLFYHFQSLTILKDNVFIGVYNETGRKSKKLIDYLYSDYISKLLETRNELKAIGVEIPVQEIRRGEKSIVKKMKFLDFIIFCYQCLPGIFYGKRNYININRM